MKYRATVEYEVDLKISDGVRIAYEEGGLLTTIVRAAIDKTIGGDLEGHIYSEDIETYMPVPVPYEARETTWTYKGTE